MREDRLSSPLQDPDEVQHHGREALVAGAATKEQPVIAAGLGPRGLKQGDQSSSDVRVVPQLLVRADIGLPEILEARRVGPQAQDVVDIGSLIVHADADAAFHAAEAAAEDDPPDLVPFLLEQQWKIGLLLTSVGKRTLVHRLPIPAQIVAPQGASAVVSPPVAGRLLPPLDGRLPRVGDQVQAGQTLALVEPPLPVTAQVQALETELALRELDLDTKALEVERSIIQSEARLDFARRSMSRLSPLRGKGVVTEKQYDEAEQSLRLAEAEHEGAKAMKRSYEDARERLAKLRSKALVHGSETTPTGSSLQIPLRAPIAARSFLRASSTPPLSYWFASNRCSFRISMRVGRLFPAHGA